MDSELAEEIAQHQNLYLQKIYNEQQKFPKERKANVNNEVSQDFENTDAKNFLKGHQKSSEKTLCCIISLK